ncbi:hypothetical protein MIT9_P1495 [Methylomarinovum caldicuralii]|uniref:Tetratricopeptide repeat protein n=1 Tax=Methylomarinovum caldicuralii TaxID=438856 RepID=A0AAU9C2S2_9GAMM|nr:hypothetical protein [Methylomarinovum caldicuralii]BCX81913.1 hypothetical protein MIT9_P1495 [Methylomarinovum caldicuralii]
MAGYADSPVEAAFFLDRWLRLQPVDQLDSATAWSFLTREIHRDPRRLVLHLARIRAAVGLDAEALYAALVDLVLTLEGRGRGLQRRMIRGAGKWLKAERRQMLERYLAGRLPLQSLPLSPRSVLQAGAVGMLQMTAATKPAAVPVDLIEAARSCLALGQLDQARELFEQRLFEEPDCRTARQELLAIYRALDDRENFARLRAHLQSHGCLDPDWEAFHAGALP